MSTTTLNHPVLGAFHGRSGENVQQYFGIQYATLKGRLSEPEIKTSYDSPVDATKYGPAAHGPPSGFENEVNLFIQQPLPKPELTYSDIDCLNLNVTIPSPKDGEVLAERRLPVFVWIHGGGFVLGANSWPQYDHAKLIKLAAERNVPVVGVGISFRLGLPALLTSEELRSAGYKANNLLRDQRAAFAWVKKYIAGFGGNPDSITVIGESSGAIAVTLHLLSREPLCERAIATGGTFLLRKPLPTPAHEATYQQAISALGLEKLGPQDRIQALLNTPMDEFISRLPPSVAFNAMIDNELITSEVSYASVASHDETTMPGKKWLQALMVGDCQFDASVLTVLLSHLSPHCLTHFPAAVHALLPPSTATRLLTLYSFPSPHPDLTLPVPATLHTQAFNAMISYINDIGYYLPTFSFARGFSRPNIQGKGSSVFFFNHGNPFPGPFQGKASHVLDVVFLFQNYNHVFDERTREAAEGFALDLMRFVSGEEVMGTQWEKGGEGMMATVYADGGTGVGNAMVGETVGRNGEVRKLAGEIEGGADRLMEVFERFVMNASGAEG